MEVASRKIRHYDDNTERARTGVMRRRAPRSMSGNAGTTIMKKTLRSFTWLFRTNRGIRVFVGLILVALLLVHVTDLTATDEKAVVKVVRVDEQDIETKDVVEFQKLLNWAKTDHVKLLDYAQKKVEKNPLLASYKCTFVKQERMRGKMGKEQQMAVKFREAPFSVAMDWKKNPGKGNAILYIEGKYKHKKTGKSQMVVRPTSGFLRKLVGGSVLREPDGKDAMRETLRPCTMFGFKNSLENLLVVYRDARKRKEGSETFDGFCDVNGRKCFRIIRTLPKHDRYPAKKTVVCLDVETLAPLSIVGYGWDDKISSNYEYRDLDMNVSLSDEHFTPKANGIEGQ